MSEPIVLRGQQEEFVDWLRRARAGRLPHALLLHGPRGAGKSTAAVLLAQALLCTTPDAVDGPCGRCGSCRRVAEDGGAGHADVHRLTPPPDKVDIPVAAVREMQRTLGRTAVEGGARVVLVDPAEALNEQGQNALLKTLEEPGHATFLILCTARPEALLPTVVSRVARYRLLPLAAAEVVDELRSGEDQVDPERAQWAAELAGGSLGVANELLADDAGVLELDGALAAFLARPRAAAVPGVVAAVLAADGKDATERRVRLALTLLRARLRQQLQTLVGTGDTRSEGVEDAGPPRYSAASIEHWATAVDATLAAEDDLGAKIPAEQTVRGLLLSLAPS